MRDLQYCPIHKVRFIGSCLGCVSLEQTTDVDAQAPPPSVDIHATRKATPVFSGVLRYFPDAIRAIAQASLVGNEQHNPGTKLHWDRAKSGDELDALARHLIDAGTDDSDGVRHSTKVAWRALANLQKEIEGES